MKELKKEYFKFFVVILVVIGVAGSLNSLLSYFLLEKSAALEFESDYGLVKQLMALYGQIVNERIETLSDELLETHHRIEADIEREGRIPSLALLHREKKELAKRIRGVVDIAVINRQGIIVRTTYAPEMNLDLSKFEDARSALEQVTGSRKIRVDFPIIESNGRFYRLYTLSWLPGLDLYVQLGYRLDMLDNLPHLFTSEMPESTYSAFLYSVYYAGRHSSVTCLTCRRKKVSGTRKKALLEAIKTEDRAVVRKHGSNGFSVFKEIRLGKGKNWNNNRDYRLVMGVDFGKQSFLVRLGWWVNLVEMMIIMLIVYYGYRKLNILLVYPLDEVSSRMDASRPVDVEGLEHACREIVTIAEAYNLHLDNIKIRNFARDLIAAQEEERKRIARELHDSVGQDLSLVLISLDMIARQYPETREFTADLSLSLKRGMAEIKDLIFNLDSESISRLGLTAAFEDCIERYRGKAGFAIDFESRLPPDDKFDISVSSNLYRILQEALNNASRHSRARRVTVSLVMEGTEVVLTIADDGVGFDHRTVPEVAADGGHFGLINMKERCRLLCGRFTLKTAPGQGCKIIVRIPVGEKHDDTDHYC